MGPIEVVSFPGVRWLRLEHDTRSAPMDTIVAVTDGDRLEIAPGQPHPQPVSERQDATIEDRLPRIARAYHGIVGIFRPPRHVHLSSSIGYVIIFARCRLMHGPAPPRPERHGLLREGCRETPRCASGRTHRGAA